MRLFLKQLWSTYFFYVLYAHANGDALSGLPAEPPRGASQGGQARRVHAEARGSAGRGVGALRSGAEDDLDRWALSRTAGTAERVAERLDAYDATAAGRAIAELVDELSNWYVRRSRRRFWDGDPAAFRTLRSCLLTIAKLLAPFCPFVADEIYDNLDGSLASVHLCDFPAGEALPARDRELEEAMAIARETVRLGLGARGQAKIKVRQPLAEAVVVAAGRERTAIERLVRRGARGAQRAARALRRRRRGAGPLRGEGQLPPPRPAVRQGDAARRRGDRGARPRASRGRGAEARTARPASASRSAVASTRSPPRT